MPGRRVRATRCRCLNWKPGKEVVEPTPCQESRFVSVETQVSLPLAPSSDTAPEQPAAECHRAQEDAGMIFSLACTLAVCLWNWLQHTHPFARLKTSLENQRFKAALENRFLVLLVVLLVGIYCGTLLSAWRMQAKAGTEEDDKGALEKSFHVNMMNSQWALKNLGATIDMKRTSPTYRCGWKWGYSLLLNRRCTEDEPDTILQMDVSQGKRWCFPGHSGHVVIRLPARVHLTAIAVQHIVEEDSLSVAASSAPKGLAVYGFEAESEEETWLGSFIYDVAKESIQPFSLKNTQISRAFSSIKLLVMSNWGSPKYTCISRVWVHGRMA
ncbi:SUN domain-containing protein 3-like [Colius striatus]|uniref:SUN domain-containing protein 3-like n=1 Tax=Colius striatus TaxID=57412 RepID=UPI002B1E1630|nr:SUN domain-containing protein 3-like [Colius striatus]